MHRGTALWVFEGIDFEPGADVQSLDTLKPDVRDLASEADVVLLVAGDGSTSLVKNAHSPPKRRRSRSWTCVACKKPWVFTDEDRANLVKKFGAGLIVPKRCLQCRRPNSRKRS